MSTILLILVLVIANKEDYSVMGQTSINRGRENNKLGSC